MSEWGNPARMKGVSSVCKSIAYRGETRGTETSKYPQEEKTTVIPQVVASERGRAQTEEQQCLSGYGPGESEGNERECGRKAAAREGESPVPKGTEQPEIRSTTGHEESCGKEGGPPPKAKYYQVTDRGEYREGKVKRTPGGE